MKISRLSQYLVKLENTPSRIQMTEILADLIKETDKEEIEKVVNLILGQLAPQYRGIVFNIADRLMIEALAKAYKTKKDKVIELYKKEGDLGITASVLSQSAKIKVQKSKLSVTDVFERLLDIAKDEGERSVERKIEGMAKLLSELDPQSSRFIARIPVGRLRLGFSDKTILDALSWMERGDKSAKNKLESAYNVLPDVGLLAKQVMEKGIDKASRNVSPVIGVPLLPMLAQRLKSPAEMIEKMGEVSVEPKFDGLRIQLHYKKSGFPDVEKGEATSNVVKAFTRNLNETSWMFPELEDIEKFIQANEVILDTEAVGVDEKRRTLANFQTTMTRRRKHDIAEISSKVKIKFNVFDIMLVDNKNLIETPYRKRREILAKVVKDGKILDVDDYEITEDPKRIAELMERKLKVGMEGIIVKKADSSYIAGRTGWRWVKMKEKEDSLTKLADTIDCVVMGYSVGKGKRVSFGLGQFLVGVRANGKIKTVSKIGTGLKDEQFRELKKKLSNIKVKVKPKEYDVHKNYIPDYWIIPKVVVEIAADEITKSPTHTAGLALRFPRLVKIRDDKDAFQATKIGEVRKLFKMMN